ncbi:MAG: hypothetical protein ACRDRX_07800 [Pseudonocardiaceae bacterium]
MTPGSGDAAVCPAPDEAPGAGIPPSRSAADATPPVAVVTVSWCCSVGSTWALMLHQPAGATRAGPTVRWIGSGVPITEPVPEPLAHELLADHGFWLFPEKDPTLRTRSVRRVGFASRDAELIALAQAIREETIGVPERPLTLATRWRAAGFSAKTALSWVHSGILTPKAAHRSTTAQTTSPLVAGTTAVRAAVPQASDVAGTIGAKP